MYLFRAVNIRLHHTADLQTSHRDHRDFHISLMSKSEEETVRGTRPDNKILCVCDPQPKPNTAITIAVSSRTLFNMVEERKIYEEKGLEHYVNYNEQHENQPLKPGAAFPFVKVWCVCVLHQLVCVYIRLSPVWLYIYCFPVCQGVCVFRALFSNFRCVCLCSLSYILLLVVV